MLTRNPTALPFAPAFASTLAFQENFFPHARRCLAHRGARALAPENTLAAARLAHSLNACAWELDVALTKDQALVVMHDDTLTRTTTVAELPQLAPLQPWRLCELTLAEVAQLDTAAPFLRADPFGAVASGFSPWTLARQKQSVPPAEAVPTLDQALALTRALNWRVNVEIKDHAHLPGHERITALVVAAIVRADMVEHTLLSSFQQRYLVEARELLPELERAVLMEGESSHALNGQDALHLCERVGANFFHPQAHLQASWASSQELYFLAQHNIKVQAWTVNNLDEQNFFLERGVWALFSDFNACG